MKKVKEMAKTTAFILVAIILFKMIVSYNLASTEYESYEYTVKGNDTLWTIAQDIGQENEDIYIRKIISDIKKINEMEDSTIYVGQTILLPIYN